MTTFCTYYEQTPSRGVPRLPLHRGRYHGHRPGAAAVLRRRRGQGLRRRVLTADYDINMVVRGEARPSRRAADHRHHHLGDGGRVGDPSVAGPRPSPPRASPSHGVPGSRAGARVLDGPTAVEGRIPYHPPRHRGLAGRGRGRGRASAPHSRSRPGARGANEGLGTIVPRVVDVSPVRPWGQPLPKGAMLPVQRRQHTTSAPGGPRSRSGQAISSRWVLPGREPWAGGGRAYLT